MCHISPMHNTCVNINYLKTKLVPMSCNLVYFDHFLSQCLALKFIQKILGIGEDSFELSEPFSQLMIVLLLLLSI
ncbi:hypothetical protein PHAVU_001G133900 [Phaseolus vulgaris]|uniref:Uncharacterized protein n=1 Tax=Phaseolus vulgaris TaxID=3885 RepID=V7CZ91_PHAVU|nr:hypothetical protein PHAVU_001G133900g [Phaseolus vulgaris]ESW34211.1 hypothetical protein PHAVU_001G133900g [Phaseolus vulgaris]